MKTSVLIVLTAFAGSAAAQEYRSAFRDYRPFVEPQTIDWRKANEEVRRIGGHLGLLREKK